MEEQKKELSKRDFYRVRKLQLDIDGEREEIRTKSTFDEKLRVEIICIITIVVGLLVLISIFNKDTGVVGLLLNTTLLRLFGYGAYLLPFIIIGLGIYFFLAKETVHRIKLYYGIWVYLAIVSLMQVISVDMTVFHEETFWQTIISNNGTGGYVGGFFGSIALNIFGKLGAIVFSIAVVLILFMLLTGKSFSRFLLFLWLNIVSKLRGDFRQVFSHHTYHDEDNDMDEEDNSFDIGRDGEKPPSPKKKKLIEYFLGNAYDENEEDNDQISDIDEEETAEEMSSDNALFYHGGYAETQGAFEDDFEDDILLPNEIIRKQRERKEAKPMAEKPISAPESTATVTTLFPSAQPDPEEEEDHKPIPTGKPYRFPGVMELLKNPNTFSKNGLMQTKDTAVRLEQCLRSFGVNATVKNFSRGPTVTRYEIVPGEGVKVSRISGLADDIALNLAAPGIRIEAPIPGKSAVGIEVPNREPQPVYLREVIDSEAFRNYPSKLAFALGKDIAGNIIIADIAKMPHLLIAGATGSGKSVCINTLITSILYKAHPDEVQLLMIDPKVVELSVYNDIPHLLIPVVTDPKKAAGALNWAVQEMINRYNAFSQTSVRDLKSYNLYKKERGEEGFTQIVVIIDELADLMLAAPGDVEDSICRLAQMARAAGIHLIIATQRPSVDVITGVIKANIPSRLAFAVSSGTDSRTILDMVGAEKLLGKGDMLFYPMGMSKPQRVQGALVTDKEVERIVTHLKKQNYKKPDESMVQKITSVSKVTETNTEEDELTEQAIAFVVEKQKASASLLQRQFRIGYNRASRLVEDLENRGIIGKEDGAKPRKVLMSYAQWKEYKENRID